MRCKPFTLTSQRASIKRQREHINDGPRTSQAQHLTSESPTRFKFLARHVLGFVDMSLRKLLVDVHTHLYLPRYASVLRSRSTAPRILTRNTPSGQSEDRLLILDDEPSGGRPVGPQVRRSTLSYLKYRGG